jgi:UDP-N-acetylmuramoyl-L-alanyl-D-glutamate--2,6-diaminopimelate ligase
MKNKIKRLIPNFVFDYYYYLFAYIGAFFYRFPSRKMIVIGVTGTKGKTSTINFIWSCLMTGGYKTGIISTANIRIGDREVLNKYHMTMPGRFVIQKLMNDMLKDGCKYCIIETTSEGIKQHRNVGIYYDTIIFTNLFPEHLQSHGNSFEKYKQTKAKIFKNLSLSSKTIDGQRIDRTIILNADSDHVDYFRQFNADKKITFSINSASDYKAGDVATTNDGVTFNLKDTRYDLSIFGKFNVYNALPAIITAKLANINDEAIHEGLRRLKVIPGRMELINLEQDFTVIVDYAHEKESMTQLLTTANQMKKEGSKIIVLLGAEGGGRDKAKRSIMGKLCAELADYVIVTNVDPYDDDPQEILTEIADSCKSNGKIENRDLFIIEDRTTAISKALSLARASDIVLITGKGAEQSMIIGSKTIAWDDRVIVKRELASLLKGN